MLHTVTWYHAFLSNNTYLYLYWLSPWSGWTDVLPRKYSISLFMLLIAEDTLVFDWGKGPKPYLENALFAADFFDALTEWPEAAGCRDRHLLDFHQSPFSRVVALIPLSGRTIHIGGPTRNQSSRRHSYGTTRCHRPATLRRGWTLGSDHLIQIICTHLYGFKYPYLILVLLGFP